jgi:hypothetical protein
VALGVLRVLKVAGPLGEDTDHHDRKECRDGPLLVAAEAVIDPRFDPDQMAMAAIKAADRDVCPLRGHHLCSLGP